MAQEVEVNRSDVGVRYVVSCMDNIFHDLLKDVIEGTGKVSRSNPSHA